MFFDMTYVYFVLPALFVAMLAQIRVKSVYAKYSKIPNIRGITGEQAARRVLDANGLGHIRVERIAGNLTDHYDPKEDVIRLSDSVFASTSTAAVGVACHEAGHAVQHAVEYFPAKLRMAIIPATRIGSTLSMFLIPIGLILAYVGYYYAVTIAYIGLVGYALCAVFQLVTLPTEFDASRRAVTAIGDSGFLNEEEMTGAKRVLSAAALTYVAALFVSIMTILRFLVLISNASGRRK